MEHRRTFSSFSSPSSLVWSTCLPRQLVAPAVSSLYQNQTVARLCKAGTLALYIDAPRPRPPLRPVNPCLRQPILERQGSRISQRPRGRGVCHLKPSSRQQALGPTPQSRLPSPTDGLRHQTTAKRLHPSVFSNNSNPYVERSEHLNTDGQQVCPQQSQQVVLLII